MNPMMSFAADEPRVNLGSLAIAMKRQVAREAELSKMEAAGAASVREAVLRPALSADLIAAASLKVDSVRLLDPELSKAISDIPLATVGVPRDQLKSPVSTAAEPGEQNLYEDVANSAQKYFLPVYLLATQRVNGQEQYFASFAADGARWALTVRFKRIAHAAIAAAARDAKELPHRRDLLLTYSAPNSGGLRKELLFDEVTETDGVVAARLYVSSIAERDELYFVLTDRSSPASVRVRRTISVAIPVGSPPVESAASAGVATLRGTWFFDFSKGVEGTEGDVWWEQVTQTVRRLVPRGQAQIAPLGQVDFDAVSLEALKQLQYTAQPIDGSVRPAPPPPRQPVTFGGRFLNPLGVGNSAVARAPVAHVQAAGRGRLMTGTVFAVRTNTGSYAKVKILEYGYSLKLQWQTYPATSGPPVPLYRETTRTLDSVVSLPFDRELHGYIFAGLGGMGTGGTQTAFKRWPVRWKGRDYSYFQETTRPNVFHYLPDAFKLARRPQSPHVPLLAFQLETAADAESPTVRLDYSAFKTEDEERLLHAAQELSSRIPSGDPAPVMLPASFDNPTFELALPRGASGGPFVTRKGAAVSSSLGLVDSLTQLPLNEFQAIWDAMADPSGQAILFQGRVGVRFPGEEPEMIPFVARLSDMAGDVLDVVYEPIADPTAETVKAIRATVRNAIESRVTVAKVDVQVSRKGSVAGGSVAAIRRGGAATALPVTLAAGEAFELDVALPPSLPADGRLFVSFGFGAPVIEPDLPEVLKVIALNQKPESSRAVQVSTFAEVLTKAGVSQLNVDFERGTTVVLKPEQLAGSTKVRYSVLDVLGRKPEADRYKYRIVTANRRPEEWRTDTSDSITVTSEDLAS